MKYIYAVLMRNQNCGDSRIAYSFLTYFEQVKINLYACILSAVIYFFTCVGERVVFSSPGSDWVKLLLEIHNQACAALNAQTTDDHHSGQGREERSD